MPWLREELAKAKIETRYINEIKAGEPSDLVGLQWLTVFEQDVSGITTVQPGTYLSQQAYIDKHLRLIDVSKVDRKKMSKPGSIVLGSAIYNMFRKKLGQLIWLEKTRIEFSFDVSMLASLLKFLSINEILYINDVIQSIIDSKDQCMFLPILPEGTLGVQGVVDASLAGRIDESSQGARALGLTTLGTDLFSPVDVVSRKVRRKGSSSFDVEMLTVVDASDMAMVIKLLVEELLFGIRPSLAQRIYLELEGINIHQPKISVVIDTDAKDAVERIYSLKDSLTISKRRRVDVSDCQELIVFGDVTEYRHISGSTNPLDCGTKKYGRFGLSKDKASWLRFMDLLYSGRYVPDLTAVERNSPLATVKCNWLSLTYTDKLELFDVNRRYA